MAIGRPDRVAVWDNRWRAAAFLTLVAIAARAQTFGNPVIGFDEQFYLLVGDRIWRGDLPFVDLFDRKPVGLFLIYASARAMGGDGFLQYKLVAAMFVVATAFAIHQIARRYASPVASLIAAAVYIVWLDFMEGEGGQSPVFYNLPVIVAAAIILRATARAGTPRRSGVAAMALIGVALQIKYSVVVEGVYFGCWLIGLAWRAGERGKRLAGSIALWIAAALLPTALALASYVAIGQGDAFVFANFLSVLGQGRGAVSAQIEGAGVMAAILALPGAFLLLGWRRRTRSDDGGARFLIGWLAASLAGIILYARFASPHYAMPALLPIACLLAPVMDAGRSRLIAGAALALVGLVGGQVVLAATEATKGGAREAAAVARAAATGGRGCIYVYDGYPALYMLADSCLPTRWAFPGHLNTREEDRPAALGVDPAVEIRRILATRPVAIVDDFPRFAGGNPVTHQLLQQALDAGYRLAACVHTGAARVRLVYRWRSPAGAEPVGCPDDAALRRGY